MTVTVSFRITGLAEIERAMKELGAQASNRIARSALNRAGTVIVKAAREKAPQPGEGEATGELKRAIAKRLRRQRRGSAEQTVLIGIERPTSRRAHFEEFGTSRQAARPFLRPALDESASEVLRVMQDAMRTGIDREIRKLAVKPKG